MMILVLFVASLVIAFGCGFYGCWLLMTREPQGKHHAAPPPVEFDTGPKEGELKPFPYQPEDIVFREKRDPFEAVNPSRERLASTGELRKLAETGAMDVIRSDNAAWSALHRMAGWTGITL